MRDHITLKEAAAVLRVASTSSVRRILALNTDEGHRLAHAGYDDMGRQLVRSSIVEAKARERKLRGNWRVNNLKHWAEPGRGQRRPVPQPPSA